MSKYGKENPSGAEEFEDQEETTGEHLQCKPYWTCEANLPVLRKETRREAFVPHDSGRRAAPRDVQQTHCP